MPPMPQPVINGADAGSVAAITGATTLLAELRSYRFSVNVVGRDVLQFQPSYLDFVLQGTLVHDNGIAIDALIGTRMVEPSGDAAISSSGRLVAGNNYIWALDDLSGTLEPYPAGSLDGTVSALSPEGLASRLVVPFAAGYERVGQETHGGVMTEHYRASTGGLAAYASAMNFNGDLTVDVWIAVDGGYLSGAHVAGTAGHRTRSDGTTVDDALLIEFDITDPNDPANVVDLPVAPLPDPVRPRRPAVDLELEYEVLPLDGAMPTPQELDNIAVTLRVRLDVGTRLLTVTVVGGNRIAVALCTTRAEEDRRAILATGGVSVVMLPPKEYGSTTTQGTRALPAVGTPLDPALGPVAPVAAGLSRAHVDPLTGRRGLAFSLENVAAEAFRKSAEGHRGEYIAVVMEGLVVATLAIGDEVAKGHFAFTGDYTDAESHRLASNLYRDPVRFPLRVVRDVEVPASGS